MTVLFDPRLSDCRRLFLSGYEIQASIGFHNHETARRQRVIIDVDLFLPLSVSQSARDSIRDVIDYDFMRSGIQGLVAERHFNLQESLVDAIADYCLSHCPAKAVRVQTQKPDVYEDCTSHGVEALVWRPGTAKPTDGPPAP
jgi:7,8-dihydroneopterin aldolase/epimerase/oxygenase